MVSPVWRGREEEIRPFGNPKASDSANLDMVAEVRIIRLSLSLFGHSFLFCSTALPVHLSGHDPRPLICVIYAGSVINEEWAQPRGDNDDAGSGSVQESSNVVGEVPGGGVLRSTKSLHFSCGYEGLLFSVLSVRIVIQSMKFLQRCLCYR